MSRAANIFPLSFLVNKCIHNKISMKNQIIMWFSGMRGAVAFALALHMNVENIENKQMLLTSTLFVVLFSIVFLGSSALPLIKILDKLFPNEVEEKGEYAGKTTTVDDSSSTSNSSSHHYRSQKIVMSKTQEMNVMDHAEYIGDRDNHATRSHHHTHRDHRRKNFFTRLNERIVRPLLIRNLSKEVLICVFKKFQLPILGSCRGQA